MDALEPAGRAMIARLLKRWRSDRHWRRFQSSVARQRADAVARHAPRRQIDARQRAIVNAALRGPAKKEA